MSVAAPDDHRTRVGHERRERMRARLIEAATLVFAELGPEAAQIDHVIRQAGVSRGTFYNYFRSTDELLHAAKDALAAEMICLVAAAADPDAPPARQLANGIKAFFDLAERHPLVLEFIARLGLRNIATGGVLPALSEVDLGKVIAAEVTATLSPRMARDILEAATLPLLLRLMAGDRVEVTNFVAAMLRMLGHPAEAAARIAAAPYTPLIVPEESLIARSEAARIASLTPGG